MDQDIAECDDVSELGNARRSRRVDPRQRSQRFPNDLKLPLSAKFIPAVIATIASAADRASHKRLLGSRLKQGLQLRLDAGLEIRIMDCSRLDQINGASK